MSMLRSLANITTTAATTANNVTSSNSGGDGSIGQTNELVTFDEQQQFILAVIPIVSGMLSVFASSTILYMIIAIKRKEKNRNYNSSTSMNRVLSVRGNVNSGGGGTGRQQRSRRISTYERILFGMCCCDVLRSLKEASSTFLMPKDTPGVWRAYGTTQTCTLLGFLTQQGFATTTYSASLAVYFLVCIIPNIHESTIRNKIEPILHILPLGFFWSTAFIALFLDIYNPVPLGIGCWIGSYPIGCNVEDSIVECTRGKNAKTFMWLFGGVPVLLAYVVLIVCMFWIYISVWLQSRKMKRLFESGIGTSNRRIGREQASAKRLRAISTQAFLYIGVYFLCYCWSSLSRTFETQGKISNTFFFLSVLSQVFYPLHGFLNFIIYICPRSIELKRQNPQLSWFRAVGIVLEIVSAVERKVTTESLLIVFDEDNDDDNSTSDGMNNIERNTIDDSHPKLFDQNSTARTSDGNQTESLSLSNTSPYDHF